MPKVWNSIKKTYLFMLFRYVGAIFPKYVANVAFSTFTKPSRHYPKKSDAQLLNKAVDINEHFEDNAIQGYRFGDGSKIIMLVHGWSSHALSMRSFIPELINNGYSVLAFDAPAHAKSTGSHLDTMQYIRFLKYVFKKYSPYGVIGHSIGGNCALFAIAELENSEVIKKQVIIGAPIGAITAIKGFIRYIKLNKSAVLEFYKIIYKKANNKHNSLSLATQYPKGLSLASLIIHDANDSVVACKNGEEVYSVLPNSELFITQKLGHLDILKSPVVINKVIEYLHK